MHLAQVLPVDACLGIRHNLQSLEVSYQWVHIGCSVNQVYGPIDHGIHICIQTMLTPQCGNKSSCTYSSCLNVEGVQMASG